MKRWFQDGFIPYLLLGPALLVALLVVPLLWVALKARRAIRGA